MERSTESRMLRSGAMGLLGLLTLAGLSACDGASGPAGPAAPDGQTTLSVRLTDAHGPVENAWIDVTELEIVGEGEEESGRITLLSDATDDDETNDDASDLILLHPDSITELVSQVEVPSGTYGQIRLIVGGAVLETDDGDVYTTGGAEHPDGLAATGTLKCPSCPQTGIKIVPPNGALELDGAATILVLDFDVHQSFGQQAGRSGMWVMHPVVVASVLETSGGIAGSVVPAEESDFFPIACGGEDRTVEEFIPQATRTVDGEETTKSGVTAADSTYAISFVPSGEWTMTFEDSVAFDGDTLVFDAAPRSETVTVEDGQTATVDYDLNGVSCASGESGGDGDGDGGGS